MMTSILPSLFRPLRVASYLAALVGVASLSAFSSARAAVPTVVANDTYSIELLAYNAATPSGNYYAIQTNLTPTFGTTQTYPNDAANNQTVTVTSSQTISGNTFTDTITISVPNSFVPTGQLDSNGNVTNSLEFSIGNYNIPTGGTGNPLDFTSALSGLTITGSANYTLNGTPGTLAVPNNKQNPLYANGNTSFSDEYSVNTPNAGDIGRYNVNSFTLTITNAVPEPSTTGAMLLGVAGLVGFTVVRRRGARA